MEFRREKLPQRASGQHMVPKGKNKELRSNSPTTDFLRISGISSYADNLKTLASLNPDWNLTPEQIVAAGKADRKIYRIRFTNHPVRFSPAEENPDTTYVLVNGTIIGILDQENTIRFKKLIAFSEIHNVSCVIQGGLYKIVDASCNVEVQQKGISAGIRITNQPKVSTTSIANRETSLKKSSKTGKTEPKQKKKTSKSKKKPIYKRVWFWILGMILVLGSCNNQTDTAIPTETTSPSTSIVQTEVTRESTSLISTEPSFTEEAFTEPTFIPTTDAPADAGIPPVTETTTPPVAQPYTEPFEQEAEQLVWLSRTGSKYHRIPNCGTMKDPIQASLQTAQNQGRTACSKCY